MPAGTLQTTEKLRIKLSTLPLLLSTPSAAFLFQVKVQPCLRADNSLLPGSPPSILALLLNSTSAHLEMRLTAPSAVRGGKNSRENHLSPDSILRLIFSLSLSCRSGSSPGVEHLELELSLLLLPSKRGVGPPFPLGSSTMAGFLLRGVWGGQGASVHQQPGPKAASRERCCISMQGEGQRRQQCPHPEAMHTTATNVCRLTQSFALRCCLPPSDSPHPAQNHAPSSRGSSVPAT